ncbi:alanine racemase [Pseudonocardia adelaidensis]|uniref:Alanine racemase n=1 Tax=Pseudonocardia adelaidensis TaxID=648754 RepID=A0ABP9N679_9PSEU
MTLPATLPGLARSAAEPLGPHFRNLPDHTGTVGTVGAAGWHVTDLLLPTVTLRRSALEHNTALFSRWCADAGVDHAPHGKTTMSPQLVADQLAAGAWGLTAATVAQARIMHSWGVPRVLIANEVVDGPGLSWLAAADPDLDGYVLADSVGGVDRMAAVLGDRPRPLSVLVELGVPGGRAGARSRDEALAVARRVAAAPGLDLAGVECFEGVYPQDRAAESVARVDRFAADLAALVADLDGLAGDRSELVLTAGGSAYPDRVVAAWEALPALSRPVRKVVRSGGYLTHDHGMYERVSPFAAGAHNPLGALRPALELWAYVLSTPEPGLAICGFGKRDAAYDADLPIPLRGPAGPLPGSVVGKLNDQHAFVRHEGELAVGDVVVLGLSHPCTVFDKWPLIPLLDDADAVVGAVRTYF